ncbi:hypothetical protein ABW21_db0208462 [Orbilia brochopaga]|nr:hypothetical protein ABW21_db0208462 [Drechslerella brochopaga]
MTLRDKISAFHARFHSHRSNGASSGSHFHLPHLIPSHRRDASSSTTTTSPPSPRSPTSKPSPSPPRQHSTNTQSQSQSSPPGSRGGKTRLSPVLTLVIPTGTASNVEARVYHPLEFPGSYGLRRRTARRAAVVAHPYASLGGNWDDPVVLGLVGLLIARGYVVATFNFGGAGNSKGKTSWTGTPEREEFATVAAFLVRYVECLDPDSFTYTPSVSSDGSTASPVKTSPDDPSIPTASTDTTEEHDGKKEKPPMKVLLAGYSYGSLIASRVPSAEHLVRGCDRDVLAYATRTAYEWASSERRRSFAMHRGAGLTPWTRDEVAHEADTEPTIKDRKSDEKVNYNVQTKLETSWLLVSPLLPPVSFLLNLPNPMSLFQRKQPSDADDINQEEHDKREVLAVYGTDDMFTAATKYRNWVKGRTERGEGKFAAVEVDGAGHFWTQEEARVD